MLLSQVSSTLNFTLVVLLYFIVGAGVWSTGAAVACFFVEAERVQVLVQCVVVAWGVVVFAELDAVHLDLDVAAIVMIAGGAVEFHVS